MPDLRGADEEEIADALPGVDNDGDLAVPDDDSGGGGSDNDDSGGGGSNGGSSNDSNDDNIEIGPVRDAETGEIKTPASQTGSGDGSNTLGAENFDNDNISSYDPENNTAQDRDDFSNVDTKSDIQKTAESFVPKNKRNRDNPLTTLEDRSGFKVREKTLVEKLRENNTQNIGPAQPGIPNLSTEKKFDRKQKLKNKEREKQEKTSIVRSNKNKANRKNKNNTQKSVSSQLRDLANNNPDTAFFAESLVDARETPTNQQQRQKDPVPFNPAALLKPGRSNKIADVRSSVRNDEDLSFQEVQRFADLIQENNISEAQLDVIQGETASKDISKSTESFLNPNQNPAIDFLAEGTAGLTSAVGEGVTALTTGKEFDLEEARNLSSKEKESFENVIGGALSEIPATPAQIQRRTGQAEQLSTGELSTSTAAAASKASLQNTKEFILENPEKAAAGGLTGFLVAGPAGTSGLRKGLKGSADTGSSKLSGLSSDVKNQLKSGGFDETSFNDFVKGDVGKRTQNPSEIQNSFDQSDLLMGRNVPDIKESRPTTKRSRTEFLKEFGIPRKTGPENFVGRDVPTSITEKIGRKTKGAASKAKEKIPENQGLGLKTNTERSEFAGAFDGANNPSEIAGSNVLPGEGSTQGFLKSTAETGKFAALTLADKNEGFGLKPNEELQDVDNLAGKEITLNTRDKIKDVFGGKRKGQAQLVNPVQKLKDKSDDIIDRDTTGKDVSTSERIDRIQDNVRTPENDNDIEIIRSNRDDTRNDLGFDRPKSRDSVGSSISSALGASLDEGLDQNSDLDNPLAQDQRDEQRQPPFKDDENVFEQDGRGRSETSVFGSIGVPREENVFERVRDKDTRKRRKNRDLDIDFGFERGDSTQSIFSGQDVQDEPQFAPSLDALLAGKTTDKQIKDDKVFTGFETRKVSENTDDVFEGLF